MHRICPPQSCEWFQVWWCGGPIASKLSERLPGVHRSAFRREYKKMSGPNFSPYLRPLLERAARVCVGQDLRRTGALLINNPKLYTCGNRYAIVYRVSLFLLLLHPPPPTYCTPYPPTHRAPGPSPVLQVRLTKRRVRSAWRSNVAGSMPPAVERAHISRCHARRVRGLSSHATEGSKPDENRSPGSKLQESRYAPQISSKSKRQPVPAVQPPCSSAAVQSLAPTDRQMASASAKVLSRVHGQPAFDSPHTEQPGRLDCQAGESLTSEQHRTCGRG